MIRVVCLAAVIGVAACAPYKVRLLSEPVGATVWLQDGTEATTPTERTFAVTPFRRQTLLVEAPGYRALPVNMQRTEGQLLRLWGASMFQRGGREITFVLIEDRPLVGSEGGGQP